MKKIVIPIFVLLILVFGYLYFSSSSSQKKILVSNNPQANKANAIVGAEIIGLLEKLDTITFDMELFSEPTFQSLRDFSITLRPQPVGRPNPFAPIGIDTQNRTVTTEEDAIVPAPQIPEESSDN